MLANFIIKDARLHLMISDLGGDFTDDYGGFFSIPIEDALHLSCWLAEHNAEIETEVRKHMQKPGEMRLYGVILRNWSLSDAKDTWIEADNPLSAVMLAMQHHNTTTMYQVSVETAEKYVTFYNVRMQGDTVDFAYCETMQK